MAHLDPVRSPAYSDKGRENHDKIFNTGEECPNCDGLGHFRVQDSLWYDVEPCGECKGTGKKKEYINLEKQYERA